MNPDLPVSDWENFLSEVHLPKESDKQNGLLSISDQDVTVRIIVKGSAQSMALDDIIFKSQDILEQNPDPKIKEKIIKA